MNQTDNFSISHRRDYFETAMTAQYACSEQGLALYRIFFASWLLLFGLPPVGWIGQNPNLFFNPPLLSVASLFREFPPRYFFAALDISIGCLTILLLFGYRTRVVSRLLALGFVLGKSFQYSFGKIDHSILQELTLGIMSFSSWGECYSLDSLLRKEKTDVRSGNGADRSGAVALLAICICFGFFSAGLPKLIGWLDFDTSTQGSRNWPMNSYYVVGRSNRLSEFFLQLSSPFIWEILDIVGIVFEMTFLCAFPSRAMLRLYLCGATLFHMFNYLVFDISFSNNLLVYAVFMNWDGARTTLPLVRRLIPRPSKRWVIFALIVLQSLFLLSHTREIPFRSLVRLLHLDNGVDMALIRLATGVIVAILAIPTVLSQAFRSWREPLAFFYHLAAGTRSAHSITILDQVRKKDSA